MTEMKKLSIFIIGLSFLATGCLKDDPNVDFSNLGAVIQMPYSGKGFFAQDAVIDAADTIVKTFTINIASPYPLNKEVNVTVGIDKSLVDEYNAYDTAVHYEAMPDSAYSFSETTVTIPAGSRLDTLQVTFYKTKLDPLKSYLLPIAIKDASGETISGNMSVHYYHFIGNPISGSYSWEWIRYNAADTSSGTPTYDEDYSPATFSPVTPTSIQTESGTGVVYILSFTNTNGALSDFTVVFDQASVDAADITVTLDPKIVVADPVNGVYRFYFEYNNSSGDHRCITDQFIKY
jgi:hypothetical protein